MPRHTFGFESHGLEEAMQKTKEALVGKASKVFVVQQANGTFLTIECADHKQLCEAALIAGSVIGEYLRQQAFFPVDAKVTFVERTLAPTLSAPPVRLPRTDVPT